MNWVNCSGTSLWNAWRPPVAPCRQNGLNIGVVLVVKLGTLLPLVPFWRIKHLSTRKCAYACTMCHQKCPQKQANSVRKLSVSMTKALHMHWCLYLLLYPLHHHFYQLSRDLTSWPALGIAPVATHIVVHIHIPSKIVIWFIFSKCFTFTNRPNSTGKGKPQILSVVSHSKSSILLPCIQYFI